MSPDPRLDPHRRLLDRQIAGLRLQMWLLAGGSVAFVLIAVSLAAMEGFGAVLDQVKVLLAGSMAAPPFTLFFKRRTRCIIFQYLRDKLDGFASLGEEEKQEVLTLIRSYVHKGILATPEEATT